MNKYNRFVGKCLVLVCLLMLFSTDFTVKIDELNLHFGHNTASAATLPSDTYNSISTGTPSNAGPSSIDRGDENDDIDNSFATPSTAVIATPSTTPRARVERISIYNILEVSGKIKTDELIIEKFSQYDQNTIDRTSFTAKNAYKIDGLFFDIKRRGSDGSVRIVSPDCEFTNYGSPYDITYDAYGGMVEWSEKEIITKVNPDVSQIRIQFIIGTKYDNGNPRTLYRELIIPLVDDRNAAPTSPKIIFDPVYPESYVLTGTDTSMEYATSVNQFRTALTWEPCTGTDLLTPLASEQFCFIRYKATDEAPESQYLQLTIPVHTSMPSLTYDNVTEKLKGLTVNMEYKLENSEYKPVTEKMVTDNISDILNQITDREQTELSVRVKATDNKPSSLARTITLKRRLETPTVTLNPITFVMTGTKSGMQYRVGAEGTWTAISSSSVSLAKYASSDHDVAVDVRYKYTTANSNSKIVTVVIPRLMNAPSTLKLDYFAEAITGFDPAKKYQGATSLTGSYGSITVTNGVYSVKNKITTTKETTFYIREAATGTTPFSAATAIVIPKRKTITADIAFVYNDPSTNESQVLLKNLYPSLEYKVNASSNVWLPCTETNMIINLPTANQTYFFREKATASSFISVSKSLSLLKKGSMPNSSLYNYNEVIKPVSNSMEYQVNGGPFQPIPNNTPMPMTEICDSLGEGETVTIGIRYMRKATAPISEIKNITIYPRPKSPQNLVYNTTTYILSGVSNKMEYHDIGKTDWLSILNPTINLKSHVNGHPNLQVEVRYKPTGNVFASPSVIVNLY